MLLNRFSRRTALSAAALLMGAVALTGCAGENATADSGDQTLSIDFATYNPLSLVLKGGAAANDASRPSDHQSGARAGEGDR